MARFLIIAILFAALPVASLTQQKYSGPQPPRKNTLYLVHADNLIETEAKTAQQQTKKDETTYLIPGDKSPVHTPLASPMLVFESDGMDAGKLRLFRLTAKNGQRTVTFFNKSKGGAIPLRTEITQVSGNLYQIEVVDSLPPGEYAFSPDGSNDVFCFQVF